MKDTHASVARPVTNTLETLAFRSIASSPVFSWEPYSQSPKAEYDSTDAWVPLRMIRSDLSLQQHHHQRSLHAPAGDTSHPRLPGERWVKLCAFRVLHAMWWRRNVACVAQRVCENAIEHTQTHRHTHRQTLSQQ